MLVGISAVQGDFAEHAEIIKQLGAEYILLRRKEDAENIGALILPGGESTTQRRLLAQTGLYDVLSEKIRTGLPVLATCAGLILLAEDVENETPCFGTLPVYVCRNAYGRQLGSFSAKGNVGKIENYPMRFIRAPYIKKVLSDKAEILNETDGRITAVRYKAMTAFSFHPELTDDLRIHEEFLKSACAVK